MSSYINIPTPPLGRLGGAFTSRLLPLCDIHFGSEDVPTPPAMSFAYPCLPSDGKHSPAQG